MITLTYYKWPAIIDQSILAESKLINPEGVSRVGMKNQLNEGLARKPKRSQVRISRRLNILILGAIGGFVRV